MLLMNHIPAPLIFFGTHNFVKVLDLDNEKILSACHEINNILRTLWKKQMVYIKKHAVHLEFDKSLCYLGK